MAVVAASTVLALLAAACDVARGGAAETAPGATCTAPGIMPDEVRLGLLYPDTGNAASLFGPFRAGVDARLGVANADGGVHGREIVYTWRDDESKPDINRTAARVLVERDDVFGIIESTSVATGSAAYLHEQGIPVTGVSPEIPWSEYDNMFSYSSLIAEGSSVSTWGDFVAERGGSSALIAVSVFSAASQQFAEVLRASLESAGVRVVGTVDASGPIDLPDLGARILDSGADTLLGAVTGAAFGQVVLAARAAGAQPRVILSPAGYDQALLRLFGPVLADVHYFVDYQPFELKLAAHQRFLDAMITYSPQLATPNQQSALAGWISTDLFLRGLAEAGACPTRERFITALRAVSGYDADGLLPEPIEFDTRVGQIGRCYTFLRVNAEGSAFQVVEPAPQCGRRLYT